MSRLLLIYIFVNCLTFTRSRSNPRNIGINEFSFNSTGISFCKQGMYKCESSNRCIPLSWVCDAEADCEKADDEAKCDNVRICAKNEYQCSPLRQGYTDLSIISNNHHDYLKKLLPPGSLFVPNCIAESWRCDGEPDCFLGDDEDGCEGKQIRCNNETHFECTTANLHKGLSCIPLKWVCDGQKDCTDGKDEQNCDKEYKNALNCEKDEFRCADGKQCIYNSWRCDGDHDCLDGSDEKECASDPCSGPDKFKCENSDFCIPMLWRCDGEHDCADYSDERNCSTSTISTHHLPRVNCTNAEFECASHSQCISKHWVCDGDTDCFDESDEKNCNNSRPECQPNQFACLTGSKCIGRELFCDGYYDCDDRSDEVNANCTTPKIKHDDICDKNSEYSCPQKPIKCIKYENLCEEGKASNDCTPSICNSLTELCTPGLIGCKCRSTGTKGKLCYCEKGFENRNGTCNDINECEQPGICDQKCVNMIGTYRCSCYHGFLLSVRKNPSENESPYKCRAIGQDPLLLLANRATIRQFDIATNRYHPIITKLESAVALDYWHKNKTLVWSDVSKETINICHLGNESGRAFANFINCMDGKNMTLINDNITTPDGLAIDWIHGLLFWTDTGLDKISVYDLTNNKRAVIISTKLDEPRAIAVDPFYGLIFWTDWGSKPRIERAGMDGKHRMEILSGDNIKWPNGLAADVMDQRLYWADAKLKTINSCDYWGNGVRTIIRSNSKLSHPFSLAVFEDKLYWTDWDQEGVISANKFTGADVTTMLKGVSGPMTVRVYHEQAQPSFPNKCENHDCQHLCLPNAFIRFGSEKEDDSSRRSGRPYTCQCALNFQVDAKNRSACLPLAMLPLVAIPSIINSAATGIGEDDTSLGVLNLPTILLLIGLLLILTLVYTYYKRRPRDFSILQFENPIYRRTVDREDLDIDMDNSLGAINILPSNSHYISTVTDQPQSKLVVTVPNHKHKDPNADSVVVDTTDPKQYAFAIKTDAGKI